MAPEIFRFMTVRPPQEVSSQTATINTIDLNVSRSDFLSALSKERENDSKAAMERLVEEFLKLDSSRLIDSRRKVDSRFLSFYETVLELPDKGFYQNAAQSFSKIFDIAPAEFVGKPEFKQLFAQVADSTVAAAIAQRIDSKTRSIIVSLAKTLGLIQKLADLRETSIYSKTDFSSQMIILPAGIFPLPNLRQDLTKPRKVERERLRRNAENQAKMLELAKELMANRSAINDLLTAYEKSTIDSKPTHPKPKKESVLAAKAATTNGFMLSARDAEDLARETKTVLKRIGIQDSAIDVVKATSLIEKQSLEIGNQLYANRSSMKYLVKIGNSLIPSDVLSNNNLLEAGDFQPILSFPGMCPPAPVENEPDEVTVPPENTHGEARVLGIADLMVVEQNLLRYELGEISHVENVLKSELRAREFKTMTTTEQSTLTETEVTDEKTKDLTSTERFELQTEAEKVINENSATQAGVTVNASYGPSVDVTANFNYTNSNSTQESTRASTNFARETTTRAASKVQKRTLERQFVRTVNEVEEINKHSFDNTKEGAANISGVYRFIDKIYHAQIVNYGKRLMLEFVVPEPAAFLRYAMTRQPAEGIAQIKPETPGYCVNNKFVELQPQNITPENYLFWTGKYLAEDVAPPPAAVQIVSGSKVNESPGKKSDVSNDYYAEFGLPDIAIPDGYKPLRAYVTVEGWGIATSEFDGLHHISVQIANQILVYDEGFAAGVDLTSVKTDKIPVSVVTKNYENISVVATVYCTLTAEKFQEWQIKVYSSIMNAYNDQKSRYDNAMEAARIRAGLSEVSGTNPLANRETEKTELKRGSLSLLTGQSFETFNAVRANAAPHGYPEIAFADAKAEGRYIQFFENAFEWPNMTYIFYSYFWGKKDEWVTISQIADDDPLFTHFLQAGAARVQVPVRPGFEISLLHYLEIGTIWFGEGTLVNAEDGVADPLHLSVLDELKEQLGNQNIEGKGRLTVTKDDDRIIGSGTEFTADDENKRIIIKGRTYLIKEVTNAASIQIAEKFVDADESGVRYSLGAKLIGEPWEVKLPTDLVMIDRENSSLIIS